MSVFDSEAVFRSKNRDIFNYLEDDNGVPNQVFLYDFSNFSFTLHGNVIVPIPHSNNQYQNTNYFRMCFSEFFHRDAL